LVYTFTWYYFSYWRAAHRLRISYDQGDFKEPSSWSGNQIS